MLFIPLEGPEEVDDRPLAEQLEEALCTPIDEHEPTKFELALELRAAFGGGSVGTD